MAPLAVSVALPPLQMLALPLMVKLGKAYTVTVTADTFVFVQPVRVLVPLTV